MGGKRGVNAGTMCIVEWGYRGRENTEVRVRSEEAAGGGGATVPQHVGTRRTEKHNSRLPALLFFIFDVPNADACLFVGRVDTQRGPVHAGSNELSRIATS
jgi:hypothetical protein